MSSPAAPLRRFASDNNAGVHPAVMEALAASNHGHATAYGDDPWTAAAERDFTELFDHDVVTLMVWNGTGANVLALGSALSPAGAVVCTDCAHINVDETGAPERFLGAKLADVPSADAKITPADIYSASGALGTVHHVQPGVVSITQATELGTLYSVDEIAAVCEEAHRHGGQRECGADDHGTERTGVQHGTLRDLPFGGSAAGGP